MNRLEHPLVSEVRGGVCCWDRVAGPVSRTVACGAERRVSSSTRPARPVRLAPPLIVNKAQVARSCSLCPTYSRTARRTIDMPRHFLRDDDLTPNEQAEVLDLAAELKGEPFGTALAGPQVRRGDLREELDPHPAVVRGGHSPAGRPSAGGRRAEHAAGSRGDHRDTARVLSRYVDCRRVAHVRRRTASKRWPPSRRCRSSTRSPTSSIPARCSPTCRRSGSARALSGLTLTYLGDGANNMAHSLLLGGRTPGMHVRVAAPDGFQPSTRCARGQEKRASETGGSATVHHRSARRGRRGRCRDHRRVDVHGPGTDGRTG